MHVADIAASRAFWWDVLGFLVAFERRDERFMYLERTLADSRAAQIMLCQRNGRWETGPLEPPLEQGMMFQIEVDDLGAIQARLRKGTGPFIRPCVMPGAVPAIGKADSVNCSCRTPMAIC